MIKFISHEYTSDDPYIKEIVYLSIDDKFRFSYIRKVMKNGGLFWSPITAGITTSLNGSKKYYESIQWDSNFLKQDILAFLEKRQWENIQKPQFIDVTANHVSPPEPKYEQTSFLDQCPF